MILFFCKYMFQETGFYFNGCKSSTIFFQNTSILRLYGKFVHTYPTALETI